jgi:hypothetical protein
VGNQSQINRRRYRHLARCRQRRRFKTHLAASLPCAACCAFHSAHLILGQGCGNQARGKGRPHPHAAGGVLVRADVLLLALTHRRYKVRVGNLQGVADSKLAALLPHTGHLSAKPAVRKAIIGGASHLTAIPHGEHGAWPGNCRAGEAASAIVGRVGHSMAQRAATALLPPNSSALAEA